MTSGGFFLCGDLGLQEAAEAARQAHDLEAQDDYAFSGMGP